MDERHKSLEAAGDGLLLAVARLYLFERREAVPYKVHSRVCSLLVRNSTLAKMAEGEGIRGQEGEKLSDAFEVAIAIHYFRHGFNSARLWLFGLFDKYLDVRAEVEHILNPPEDGLTKQVRGALKMVISQHGGNLTSRNLDAVAKQIVAQLRSNGNGAH